MTDRKNMSIMELAYQMLLEQKKAMTFVELFDAICVEKQINEEEKAGMISQVYTDFISSAKFIYVGDDEWDIKGRRTIDLWDKDGAYYDEYPDYEEELNTFEDEKHGNEYSLGDGVHEKEEDSVYEADVTEEDIKDEEDTSYDEFEENDEDYVEDEEDLKVEEVVKEKVPEDEEESAEFDDEEYNEYMDDYEEMYED
jgi:DNA-directed RNA polymerase subunit delta